MAFEPRHRAPLRPINQPTRIQQVQPCLHRKGLVVLWRTHPLRRLWHGPMPPPRRGINSTPLLPGLAIASAWTGDFGQSVTAMGVFKR